jgi:glutathione S-transferase
MLSDLLGINYRRIPVLAIDRDVYIDTSLIAATLTRRFSVSSNYATLFPARRGSGSIDTGMIKAFVMNYVDRGIFPLASTMLPWDKLPSALTADRAQVCIN